jgi:LysM repeat protein
MHSPNNPSPLLPQGVLMDQKNSSRSRVKLAFFCVVGVHVAGLLVLLMQGCKRENTGSPDTGTQPGAVTPAETIASNTQPADIAAATNQNPVEPPTITPPLPPAPPAGAAQEYAIQKGDSFYTIAKKFNVTQKAIQEANPKVDPLKLQLGQKITVPPPAPATQVAAATNGATLPTGETIYVVKSGDVLGTIARNYKVSVNAIMQANPNITDPKKIKVGDKLKIPKATTAPAPPPP